MDKFQQRTLAMSVNKTAEWGRLSAVISFLIIDLQKQLENERDQVAIHRVQGRIRQLRDLVEMVEGTMPSKVTSAPKDTEKQTDKDLY